ncbi:MAG: DUF6498-containing protein [Chitinophagales bacterium]
MFKRTLTQPDISLIAANLLPVIGVWFFGWNPKEVFMVYCLETIIIGFYNLVKMAIITAVRKTDIWENNGVQTRVSGLFFMFFFLVHYGLFVAVQMGIFFSVSGIADQTNFGFFSFFYKWPQLMTQDTLIMLGVFFISHGYKMFAEFIVPGLYKTTPLGLQMFQPYMRIFIQQFAVILGSMFLLFGAGKIFILIFALIKIAFEVYVNYEGLLNKAIAGFKERS